MIFFAFTFSEFVYGIAVFLTAIYLAAGIYGNHVCECKNSENCRNVIENINSVKSENRNLLRYNTCFQHFIFQKSKIDYSVILVPEKTRIRTYIPYYKSVILSGEENKAPPALA